MRLRVLGATLLALALFASGSPGRMRPGPDARMRASAGARMRAPVHVYVHLKRRHSLRWHRGTVSGPDAIAVNPGVRYQRLTAGFGVAMTDTSAYLLRRDLGARTRNRLMRMLFSRRRGIGLSFLRVPVGGSDFVVGAPYTYDDMPRGSTDPELAHFSIAHDRPYVIPMIRQALRTNRRITVIANPWTPPAWMKTDDSLITRTGPLGTLIPTDYGVYASYLVRFVQQYRAAGIRIAYLGVQNEPLTPLLLVAGIPESYLSPQDEGRLIHGYVAPALRQAGLRPKLVAYDDGFQRSEAYIPIVMKLAAGDVGGLAYHCYLSDASSMSIEHGLFPREPELETECSSYLSNIEPSQMAIRSLRNWAQGVQLWNAALDQNFGPKIGSGCQGETPPHLGQQCIAPAIIDTRAHRFSLTSDFWELGQFSKFIKLGARRIASTDPSDCHDSPAPPPCGLEDVAFRNPDGSQVLVATSHDGKPHRLTVDERGRHFSFTVRNGSTVTFVWK